MSAEPKKVEAPEEPEKPQSALNQVFGDDYNVVEVRFTIFAAILIAINNGFVNGVTMSGFLSINAATDLNPGNAMVSGVAGYVTNTATFLVSGENWFKYRYNLMMFISYMFGAFITAILSPKAKPYAIDPMFGPSFMIGGTMLLGSSILSYNASPTRWIYYLAICANGVQNGVASIYSANLIRCTLTGAATDIGICIGQIIRGNYSKVGKGSVLALIVTCFWIGGLIAYHAVRALESYTLFINAGIFYSVGILNIVYLVTQLNLSFTEALIGNWDWRDVLNKIQPSGGKQEFLDLFDEIDDDDGGTLDMYELEKGLSDKVSPEELKALLQAADADGDGEISKAEWEDLVRELFDEHDDDEE
mmetsp:Transcript_7827/g.19176  ORF Transcript_7827/g.19176 Transcript_7827/m.19176 type:complete len:361 (-) Transcript_7827:168-1250(-)